MQDSKLHMSINIKTFSYAIIAAIFFVGLHTNYTYYISSGLPVPSTICLLLAVMMIFISPVRVFKLFGHEWRIMLFLIISVLLTIFSPANYDFKKSLIGSIQLIYSIVLALIFCLIISLVPRGKICNLALCGIIVITILSYLESYSYLKTISDNFRASASPNWFYDNDSRDIEIYNHVRSKVFSPEPSIAAMSLYFLSMIFLWSMRINVYLITIWLLAISLSLFSISSPILSMTIIIGLGTVSVWLISDLYRSRRWVYLLCAMSSTLSVLLVCVFLLYLQMQQKIEVINSGEASFQGRITGSMGFAFQHVLQHPIIGVGAVGNLDIINTQMRDYYAIRNQLYYTTISDSELAKSITNNIANHLIYFGGMCGVINAIILIKALKIKSKTNKFLVVLQICFLWISIGGYITPLNWCMTAAIGLVARLKNQEVRCC